LVVGEPVASDLSVLVDPWLLTEDDIPWLFKIFRKKYSQRYDPITTEGWYRNIVLKQPLMFLPQRTHNAFCFSMMTMVPWLPSEFSCDIVAICADDGAMWEAMKLMRSSIAWARSRKCTYWRMSSDTETDLAAFARRIGADEVSPRFMIRL
jgi:hypothetical protein